MDPASISHDHEGTQFLTKLGTLCKARFPFILITTHEEERAIGFIETMAEDSTLIHTKRKVILWSIGQGFTDSQGTPFGPNQEQDSFEVLDRIGNLDEPIIWVIKDFQPFIGNGDDKPNPKILRKIKALGQKFQQNQTPQNIIFLSPTLNLPPLLEKDIHVLDLHYPSFEEIQGLLHDMLKLNQGGPQGGGVQSFLTPEVEERLIKAAQGLTLQEVENAFAFAMANDGKMSLDDVHLILEEKCQILRKNNLLEFIHSDLNMDEVGGLESLKSWVSKRNNAWKEAARRYGLPNPKGMMVAGVPGCGKSLLAKAISSIWQIPLLRLDPGRLYSGLLGSSEENIRTVIKTAEAISPCILWIDEIEKGFNTSNSSGDSGTSSRIFGSFLTWMQEKHRPVFVFATANNIRYLPPEFLRKGRFDEIFFVDLPNLEERKAILYLHLKKRLKYPEVIGQFRLDAETLHELGEKTKGFNGAELEHVVINALFEAFSEKRPIRLKDLFNTIEQTVPLSITQEDQIKQLRTWAKHRAVPASPADKPL